MAITERKIMETRSTFQQIQGVMVTVIFLLGLYSFGMFVASFFLSAPVGPGGGLITNLRHDAVLKTIEDRWAYLATSLFSGVFLLLIPKIKHFFESKFDCKELNQN